MNNLICNPLTIYLTFKGNPEHHGVKDTDNNYSLILKRSSMHISNGKVEEDVSAHLNSTAQLERCKNC